MTDPIEEAARSAAAILAPGLGPNLPAEVEAALPTRDAGEQRPGQYGPARPRQPGCLGSQPDCVHCPARPGHHQRPTQPQRRVITGLHHPPGAHQPARAGHAAACRNRPHYRRRGHRDHPFLRRSRAARLRAAPAASLADRAMNTGEVSSPGRHGNEPGLGARCLLPLHTRLRTSGEAADAGACASRQGAGCVRRGLRLTRPRYLIGIQLGKDGTGRGLSGSRVQALRATLRRLQLRPPAWPFRGLKCGLIRLGSRASAETHPSRSTQVADDPGLR